MKSNVCKIEKGIKYLAAILKESEKVAAYNELTHKQTLQLRLLCEELDGMLPNVIGDYDGELWFEYEDGVCKVNASITIADFNATDRRELIAIAKNKKNASAVGVVGKIRSALEGFFLNEKGLVPVESTMDFLPMATGYNDGAVGYSYYWSLEQYRTIYVEKEREMPEWDALEKSVIAAVADDIIIGIKGRQADIVIVKKFA